MLAKTKINYREQRYNFFSNPLVFDAKIALSATGRFSLSLSSSYCCKKSQPVGAGFSVAGGVCTNLVSEDLLKGELLDFAEFAQLVEVHVALFA